MDMCTDFSSSFPIRQEISHNFTTSFVIFCKTDIMHSGVVIPRLFTGRQQCATMQLYCWMAEEDKTGWYSSVGMEDTVSWHHQTSSQCAGARM